MGEPLPNSDDDDDDLVIRRTQAWLRMAVIGLNLCPFAKAVDAKSAIRYVVCHDTDAEDLANTLSDELTRLAEADPGVIETTLIIHPRVLGDFFDYNDFLEEADTVVDAQGLSGVIQVASFHPQYCFAGTRPDDPGNASNRSPYPMLHLLREASVDRAVIAFPEAEAIYETNIRTLQALGADGWAALQARIDAA